MYILLPSQFITQTGPYNKEAHYKPINIRFFSSSFLAPVAVAASFFFFFFFFVQQFLHELPSSFFVQPFLHELPSFFFFLLLLRPAVSGNEGERRSHVFTRFHGDPTAPPPPASSHPRHLGFSCRKRELVRSHDLPREFDNHAHQYPQVPMPYSQMPSHSSLRQVSQPQLPLSAGQQVLDTSGQFPTSQPQIQQSALPASNPRIPQDTSFQTNTAFTTNQQQPLCSCSLFNLFSKPLLN